MVFNKSRKRLSAWLSSKGNERLALSIHPHSSEIRQLRRSIERYEDEIRWHEKRLEGKNEPSSKGYDADEIRTYSRLIEGTRRKLKDLGGR